MVERTISLQDASLPGKPRSLQDASLPPEGERTKALPRHEVADGFDFPASHQKIKREFALCLLSDSSLCGLCELCVKESLRSFGSILVRALWRENRTRARGSLKLRGSAVQAALP